MADEKKKPTEEDKKTKQTEYDYDGTITCQGRTKAVKIKVKTKPNKTSGDGYDTEVIVPRVHLIGKKET